MKTAFLLLVPAQAIVMSTRDGLLDLTLTCNGDIQLGTREGGLGISRRNGFLKCGIGNTPGFSNLELDGSYTGFDVEYCKAVAAAVFGEGGSDKVEYTVVTSTDRFNQLADGTYDLMSRTTTWTLERDTNLDIIFAPTTFYDGQGMMVRTDSGINTLAPVPKSSYSACRDKKIFLKFSGFRIFVFH